MLLAGRVAVVTGGGRGIGRAIARRFAAEGSAVLVTARTEGEVRSVAGEIAALGGKSAYLVADVALEQDCSAIVAAARAAVGFLSTFWR